jgi:hypothetical protein
MDDFYDDDDCYDMEDEEEDDDQVKSHNFWFAKLLNISVPVDS